MADASKKYKKKIIALKGLARCCTRVKKYSSACKIYLRALEYCWYNNDMDQELEIYDKMGYNYFNME